MINYITAPFRWFFKLEAASGLVLLISAIIALILSNTNFSDLYFEILNTHLYILYPNPVKPAALSFDNYLIVFFTSSFEITNLFVNMPKSFEKQHFWKHKI